MAQAPAQTAFRLVGSIADVAAETDRRQRAVRVVRASVVMVLVLATGTGGFWWLTKGLNPLLDCLYMTVITVSTVGSSEVIPADTEPLKWFTMGMILLGGGSIVYFVTSVTAVVVEGDLIYRMWRQRMSRQLSKLRNHVVLAGIGRTGIRTLEELWNSHVEVVVIERDPERIEVALRTFGERLLFIVGDALDEANLREAGLHRAHGLITALQDDRENLFCCVTARPMNTRLRVVTKVVDNANIPKFLQIGVASVVNPSRMAARRLAGELLRPKLMAFTDAMLTSASHRRLLGRINIGDASRFAGRPLADAGLPEAFGCMVMGIRGPGDRDFSYPPPANAVLAPGGAVVVMGTWRQLRRLRRALSREVSR